jgi:hypothetical protein
MSQPMPASLQPISERKFWRFHLSTAVVLSLVVAGLLWVNLSPRQMRPWSDILPNHYFLVFGWPMTAYIDATPALERGIPNPMLMEARIRKTEYGWKFLHFVLDFSISISILILAGAFSEFLIRRREGRKT